MQHCAFTIVPQASDQIDLCSQLLTSYYDENLIGLLKAYNLDLDINYNVLNEEIVNKLKNAGIKINCWTVDDKDACEQLIKWGVDFVTTNILE